VPGTQKAIRHSSIRCGLAWTVDQFSQGRSLRLKLEEDDDEITSRRRVVVVRISAISWVLIETPMRYSV